MLSSPTSVVSKSDCLSPPLRESFLLFNLTMLVIETLPFTETRGTCRGVAQLSYSGPLGRVSPVITDVSPDQVVRIWVEGWICEVNNDTGVWSWPKLSPGTYTVYFYTKSPAVITVFERLLPRDMKASEISRT